jgi:hypothetical protein
MKILITAYRIKNKVPLYTVVKWKPNVLPRKNEVFCLEDFLVKKKDASDFLGLIFKVKSVIWGINKNKIRPTIVLKEQ